MLLGKERSCHPVIHFWDQSHDLYEHFRCFEVMPCLKQLITIACSKQNVDFDSRNKSPLGGSLSPIAPLARLLLHALRGKCCIPNAHEQRQACDVTLACILLVFCRTCSTLAAETT